MKTKTQLGMVLAAGLALGLADVSPRAALAEARTSSPPIKFPRIDGRSKPRKSPQAAPPGTAPDMPACALSRQSLVASKREALLAKHGGHTAAFDVEYAAMKRSLLSDDALEADGCKP